MRVIALFLLLPGFLMAQTAPDSLWIVPAKPHPGDQITISFRTGNAALVKARLEEGGLYPIDKNRMTEALDLSFHKAGDGW
jgi:hypothetical protein